MRKVKKPTDEAQARKHPPALPTNNFEHGVIKDAPASDIPHTALADALNVFVFPTEIQGCTGSELYTLAEIPAIPGRTGYSASKSGNVLTCTLAVFSESDIGNYWVWPTGLHDEIIEYISTTQVRVANTGDISTQIGCYLRGKNNGFGFHKQLRRWQFQFGQDFYHSTIELPTPTRALIVSRVIPNNTQSGYDDFDDYMAIWFNSRGMFQVNQELVYPLAYQINSPIPNIAIPPVAETDNSNFAYRIKYTAARIDGNGAIRKTLKVIAPD